MTYLAVWDCGCSDVQRDFTLLPDVCPGHGRPRIYDTSGSSVSPLPDTAALGHDCDTDRPCPEPHYVQ